MISLTDQVFSGRTVRWLSVKPNRLIEHFMMVLDVEADLERYPFDRTLTNRRVVDHYVFESQPKTGAALVYQREHTSERALEFALRARRPKEAPVGEPPPREVTQAILERLAGYRGVSDPLSDAWFNAATAGSVWAFTIWTGERGHPVESLYAMTVSRQTDPEAVVEQVVTGLTVVLHVEPLSQVLSTLQTPTSLRTRFWRGEPEAYDQAFSFASGGHLGTAYH